MSRLADSGALVNKSATVAQVRESLVLIEIDEQSAVKKNEVGYVCVGDERLKAEVLRIRGRTADMQVFEDTNGVRVGDRVEMTDEMLSATLGPGLLGRVFDGLQNPLTELAEQYRPVLRAAMQKAGIGPAAAHGESARR